MSINTGPKLKLPIALKESGKLITLAFVNCKDIPLNVNIVPSVVINGFIETRPVSAIGNQEIYLQNITFALSKAVVQGYHHPLQWNIGTVYK